jgi:hypothetical protein
MLTKRGRRSHAVREHPERCDHLDYDYDNDYDNDNDNDNGRRRSVTPGPPIKQPRHS